MLSLLSQEFPVSKLAVEISMDLTSAKMYSIHDDTPPDFTDAGIHGVICNSTFLISVCHWAGNMLILSLNVFTFIPYLVRKHPIE